jgi:hypothetical protein
MDARYGEFGTACFRECRHLSRRRTRLTVGKAVEEITTVLRGTEHTICYGSVFWCPRDGRTSTEMSVRRLSLR